MRPEKVNCDDTAICKVVSQTKSGCTYDLLDLIIKDTFFFFTINEKTGLIEWKRGSDDVLQL